MALKNLGLVVAMIAGTSAPSNTKLIWYDTSLTTPLHKYYNPVTTSWEAFVYSTLIDNLTIKKNGSDQLYVDTSVLDTYAIPDNSVALSKLIQFASGTVLYRRTAGTGNIEATTLAQLKADLGLIGTNSGDQDVSIFALKTISINGHTLASSFNLTASDVGAPTGSGTSTGTNTGDETQATILNKLGILELSGDNTGDQLAAGVPIEDTAGNFSAGNVEDALAELVAMINTYINMPSVIEITLPAGATVAQRIAAAIEGTDYPTGWVLSADGTNIDITHNLGRAISNVTVFNFTDTTTKQMRIGSAAYTGVYDYDSDAIKIQSLATVNAKLSIYLFFD